MKRKLQTFELDNSSLIEVELRIPVGNEKRSVDVVIDTADTKAIELSQKLETEANKITKGGSAEASVKQLGVFMKLSKELIRACIGEEKMTELLHGIENNYIIVGQLATYCVGMLYSDNKGSENSITEALKAATATKGR